MKPLALEKEMFERMGFTNFTTKWQKIQEEQEEVDNDMKVQVEFVYMDRYNGPSPAHIFLKK